MPAIARNVTLAVPDDEPRLLEGGMLTVLADAPTPRGSKCRFVVIRCACGTEKTVKRSSLFGPGRSKSCGCLRIKGHDGSRKSPEQTFGPVRPAIAEIYLPPVRLLGRAVIALSGGPLTAERLAEQLRIPFPELDERAEELLPRVEWIRWRGGHLMWNRDESWTRIDAVRSAA